MAEPSSIFRVAANVPRDHAQTFADAIEPLCDAVSWSDWEGKNLVRVLGFSSGPPDRARLIAAFAVAASAAGTPDPTFEVEQLPFRDWVVENLKDFPPFSVGRFFIYGAEYDGIVPAGQCGLRVPAGAAFGSGDHGSTKGCLLALDELAGKRHFVDVLDMGCGSGILAVAVAKCWPAARVIALDIDPKSVATAARNAKRNRVATHIQIGGSRGYRTRVLNGKTFDLILANILARPLCRMAPDLGRHLRPGGLAILSGLLESDGNRVLSAHRGHGLHLVRRIVVDGWLTLVLRKGG